MHTHPRGQKGQAPRACSRTQVLDPRDLLCARQVPAPWEAEPQVGTVSSWGACPEGEMVSGDTPPWPPHAPRAFFWKDPVSGFPSSLNQDGLIWRASTLQRPHFQVWLHSRWT